MVANKTDIRQDEIVESAEDLAAPTDLPLLIVGPTGAGKEVLAQRVHDHSRKFLVASES